MTARSFSARLGRRSASLSCASMELSAYAKAIKAIPPKPMAANAESKMNNHIGNVI